MQAIFQKKLYPIDPELAMMMSLLFKKNVQGDQPPRLDMKRVVTTFEKRENILSNVSLKVFEHADFLNFKTAQTAEDQERVEYLTRRYSLGDSDGLNRRIAVDQNLKPQSFWFSNNDNYLAVLGKTKLLVIQVRKGQILHSKQMPHSLDCMLTSLNVECMHDRLSSESNIEKERESLIQRHPRDWMASISNSGKVLALYDRAQPKRNALTIHPGNVQESMII